MWSRNRVAARTAPGWKATRDEIDLSVPTAPKKGRVGPSLPSVAPSKDLNATYWVTNNVL